MILPYLLGLRDYIYAPITWTLVLLNMFFFILTADADRVNPPKANSGQIFESRGLQQTGVFYRQYLGEKELPPLTELLMWGGKALRDPGFLKNFESFEFKGDALEIKEWKSDVTAFRDSVETRSSSKFGLPREASAAFKKPLTWLTYQFMHAGALHLFSNMVFLLIFGTALERNRGSLTLLLGHLFGGIAGAGFALWTDDASAVPMVGASASVSAVMALYLVTEAKRNIRYFYFISPFPGGYGDIYLSKWWLLPVCFASDVVNFLMDQIWAQDLMSQAVATSAHVGGALFGLIIGSLLVVRSHDVPYFRSRPEAP